MTSATTDASGNYLFTGLKPGTYSVQFDKTTLPAGYAFTTAGMPPAATDRRQRRQRDHRQTVQTVLDSGELTAGDAGIVAKAGSDHRRRTVRGSGQRQRGRHPRCRA